MERDNTTEDESRYGESRYGDDAQFERDLRMAQDLQDMLDSAYLQEQEDFFNLHNLYAPNAAFDAAFDAPNAAFGDPSNDDVLAEIALAEIAFNEAKQKEAELLRCPVVPVKIDDCWFFQCPHCGIDHSTSESEIACHIFTCFVSNIGQIGPHAKPEEVEREKQRAEASKIPWYGCGMQYQLVPNASGGLDVVKCQGK